MPDEGLPLTAPPTSLVSVKQQRLEGRCMVKLLCGYLCCGREVVCWWYQQRGVGCQYNFGIGQSLLNTLSKLYV